MLLSKFEIMLKTDNVYFFDSAEFEEIIQHYLDTGTHSLAKKAIKLGLEQHPTSIPLKLLKVELLIFQNKLKKAIFLLSEIQDIEPCNEEVYIQKATIFSKKNQHIKAIRIFKEAIKYSEDSTDIWSMIGMEYLYLDDFKNAQVYFLKCIDADFQDYSSLHNLIYCFDMQKKHKKAIQFLLLYIDQNPYSEVAWHQLGRQYFILNMFEKALKSFDYAILIDEGFIGGYLEKAKTLERLKHYQQAIENYLITVKLDDPTAFVYLRIGKCFNKLKQIDTAIKFYKKATHQDPLLDKAWNLLANAYCKKNEYQKALYYIGKAIDIDDSKTIYWRKYAKINLKLNFYKQTVKALNKCIDLGDDSIEIYLGLTDVLYFLGNFNDALNVMIKAREIYKKSAKIEYQLFVLYMILNKKSDSFIHLKNGLSIDFEYHTIIKELYPKVFYYPEIQNIIDCNKNKRK